MSEIQQQLENNHREIKIIRAVNVQAENFYADAVQIGDHAAFALQKDHRSQMTGLENIAESAFKTSDVFDYIKRQIARREYWRKDFPGYSDKSFGERLKDYLEHDIEKRRNVLCTKRLEIGDKTDEDKQLRRHIYLLLIRQFIRQMVIQY